jgi:hypothetical protein
VSNQDGRAGSKAGMTMLEKYKVERILSTGTCKGTGYRCIDGKLKGLKGVAVFASNHVPLSIGPHDSMAQAGVIRLGKR